MPCIHPLDTHPYPLRNKSPLPAPANPLEKPFSMSMAPAISSASDPINRKLYVAGARHLLQRCEFCSRCRGISKSCHLMDSRHCFDQDFLPFAV
jgi:hypothetical protein